MANSVALPLLLNSHDARLTLTSRDVPLYKDAIPGIPGVDAQPLFSDPHNGVWAARVVFHPAAFMLLAAAAISCVSGKELTMTRTPPPGASRAPPPLVPPVVIAGMRYAQVPGDVETDGQVGGMLAACDASHREVWRLKVYPNPRRPELEGDVQDVWFRSMRVDGGRLLIENERGERFEVDPATRKVLGRAAPAVDQTSDIDPISSDPRIRRRGDVTSDRQGRDAFRWSCCPMPLQDVRAGRPGGRRSHRE
jgi:hypothetical protein